MLFEYVLLAGENDSAECAEQVLALVRGVECKVNLIVFNPHEGTRFQPSTPKAVETFRCVLAPPRCASDICYKRQLTDRRAQVDPAARWPRVHCS